MLARSVLGCLCVFCWGWCGGERDVVERVEHGGDGVVGGERDGFYERFG